MSLGKILATVLAPVVLVGCSVGVGGGPDLSDLLAPPRGEPSGPASGGRVRPVPQSGGEILNASELRRLYQAILETYVEPVDHSVLITGAVRGAHDGSVESALFPLESGLFDTARLGFSGDPDRDWAQVQKAYEAFLRKLVNRVDVRGVGQGVARGMLNALEDPNTTYLTRRTVEAIRSAEYVGIGVVLFGGGDHLYPTVREVVPSSPAEEAGMRVGDRIVAVDAASTEAMALGEVVERIRGAEGTRISLTIKPAGMTETRQMDVRRTVVRLPPFSSELREGIGYIRLRSFQEGIATAVRGSLVQFAGAGARGWIIDIRANDGGSFQEAINVASLFVGEQTIAVQEDRSRRRIAVRGSSRPLTVGLPVVVIVDNATGGAAEVFAAALHDYDLGVVIGTRTAGKVGLTTALSLPDGSVAQITSQRLLSPMGAQLHKVGLMPDDVVESRLEDLVAGRDPPLERAVARLTGGA